MSSPRESNSTPFDDAFEQKIFEQLQQLLATEAFQEYILTDKNSEQLLRLFRCSDFCVDTCLRQPQAVIDLLTNNVISNDYHSSSYIDALELVTQELDDLQQLGNVIREFRNREMLRLAWRDCVLNVDVEITLRELSWLAEACILLAIEKISYQMKKSGGPPLDSSGHPVELVTLAMGKLGAFELNYSSDIDLIFTYREDGVIESHPRQLSIGEYFIQFSQKLVKLLSETTAYGFVFRVDTRLRPFGNSGRLALSFDAIEAYYERHGREWERYALIKARAISRDKSAAEEIENRLHPFIYRRYLDFGAFSSLREMKQLIDQEIKRKGSIDNVKLGAGGIREIEFIGQAFQLIRGGRESELQIRSILGVLNVLKNQQLIPEFVYFSLREAYLFLRKTENAIQAFADQQTHIVPQNPLNRLRIAYALGFSNIAEFEQVLNQHMQTVHEHFEQIFSAPQLDQISENTEQNDFSKIWLGQLDDEGAESVLINNGFSDARQCNELIKRTKSSMVYRTASKTGRQRLDKFMPMLLSVSSGAEHPDVCLLRLLRLIEAIAKRTAYIALLAEHPVGLSQLVQLFDKSEWVADLLINNPALLDELLDARNLYSPMTKADLVEEVAPIFRKSHGDVEEDMLKLIEFKQSNVLKVAASELMNVMPVEKVSDHLTYIAEIVLDATSRLAYKYLEDRHGKPTYKLDESREDEAGFGIIAYGKLGGLELGFGSDLDLVFLHDSQGKAQQTNGEKVVENAIFFARFAQRIIHFLNTATQGGKLYEVDTRLRPSGSAGLLVSSLKNFTDYQHKQAWTWEHQALIRARMVSGSEKISEAFSKIRHEIITLKRDAGELQKDVREMRIKMRQALLKPSSKSFDLKQGVGGIADIEFIIQFLVLRWAHDYPDLATYTDNLRLIETLSKFALLAQDDARMLTHAYLTYRHVAHQQILQGEKAVLEETSEIQQLRDNVKRIWDSSIE